MSGIGSYTGCLVESDIVKVSFNAKSISTSIDQFVKENKNIDLNETSSIFAKKNFTNTNFDELNFL